MTPKRWTSSTRRVLGDRERGLTSLTMYTMLWWRDRVVMLPSTPSVSSARTVPTFTLRSSPGARVRTGRWSRREATLDGRNRLAACRRAGVEPAFTTLDGQDPVSYVLSANVNRRNLSKGQRAMAVARLLVSNNLTQEEAAETTGVLRSRLSHANTVLSHASELADAVMAGTVPLNDAYAEARQRKEAKESREEKASRARRDWAWPLDVHGVGGAVARDFALGSICQQLTDRGLSRNQFLDRTHLRTVRR